MCRYQRAADFSDHLPGFVQDRQPLGFGGVGAGQTASQRAEEQVLGRGDDVIVCEKLIQRIAGVNRFSGRLTLGKPASSQSLIMPMKSVARTATNSGLNALMTEFNSKALWETNTQLQPLTILVTSELFSYSTHLLTSFLHLSIISVSRA